MTPLALAVVGGHQRVYRLTSTRNNTEGTFRDNEGTSLLAHAAHRGHDEIVQDMLGLGWSDNSQYELCGLNKIPSIPLRHLERLAWPHLEAPQYIDAAVPKAAFSLETLFIGTKLGESISLTTADAS